MAVGIVSAGQEQIAIYDLVSRTLTGVSAGGGINQRPEWTADGRRVLYRSERQGASVIVAQPADGNAPAEPLLKNVTNVWEAALSADGRMLAYRTGTVGSSIIWLQALEGRDSTARPRAIGDRMSTSWGPRFSPNGQWLAYSSNKGGSRQIFVESVDGSSGRIQISNEDGSDAPLWSPDGRRLFYVVNTERLVAADLETTPTVHAVSRTTLLDGGYDFNVGHASYDITPDGKQLLLLKNVSSDAEVIVAYNWAEQARVRIRAGLAAGKR
jgi:Tol biopolymer transport system component